MSHSGVTTTHSDGLSWIGSGPRAIASLDIKDECPKTILIFEDDEAVRFIFKFIIEKNGYQVFDVPNGRAGIELLPHIPAPSLILLDLMMPEMNGWEVLDHVKSNAQWRDIPVVVITAFPLEGEARTELRADDVLFKPLNLDVLMQTVEHHSKTPPPGA